MGLSLIKRLGRKRKYKATYVTLLVRKKNQIYNKTKLNGSGIRRGRVFPVLNTQMIICHPARYDVVVCSANCEAEKKCMGLEACIFGCFLPLLAGKPLHGESAHLRAQKQDGKAEKFVFRRRSFSPSLPGFAASGGASVPFLTQK